MILDLISLVASLEHVATAVVTVLVVALALAGLIMIIGSIIHWERW